MRSLAIDHDLITFWNPLGKNVIMAETFYGEKSSTVGDLLDHLNYPKDIILRSKDISTTIATVTEVNREVANVKGRLWVLVKTEEVTEANLRLLWCIPVIYGIHTRFVQDLSSNGVIYNGVRTLIMDGFSPDLPPSVCITQYNNYCLHMLASGMPPMAFDKFLGRVGELNENLK